MCRAENFQLGRAEGVDDPVRQRRFRADHRQAHAFAPGKFQQRADSRNRHIDHPLFGRRAAITRRDEDLRNFGRLHQFPRQRVLTTTGADD